jgi:hypothetical protein
MPRIIDEDYIVQEIASIRRELRELRPSLMAAAADAISTAVTFDTAHENASAFAIPTGGIGATSVIEAVVTVPAGYGYAGVVVIGFLAAKNTTGGALPLQAVFEIDGIGDDLTQVSVAAGGTVPITVGRAYHGAVSDEVTINLKAGSTSPWALDASNWAMLSALVTFRRSA